MLYIKKDELTALCRSMRMSHRFLAILLFLGCQASPQQMSLDGRAQGTTYKITYWAEKHHHVQILHDKINQELQRIDRELSNYREDSTIEKINQSGQETILVTNEIGHLIETAKVVHTESNRCYDLTVKGLVHLWKAKEGHLNLPSRPSQRIIERSLKNVGMDKITIKDNKLHKDGRDVQIDLSSIAQGYTIERIAQLMAQSKITNYLIELGGEMAMQGKRIDSGPWSVGIETPSDQLPGQIFMTLSIKRKNITAIMTSGTYRNYAIHQGKKYSHIIDPKTGHPVKHSTVSVTVVLPSPTLADAWSTALLCLGTEKGLPIATSKGITACFIDDINGVYRKTCTPTFMSEMVD